MANTFETQETAAVVEHSTLAARFMWAMVGPMALFAALVAIAQSPQYFSFGDVFFAAALAGMIGGRYAEQRTGNGTTLYGAPSTWAHFQRYVMGVLAVASGLWVVVKFGCASMN